MSIATTRIAIIGGGPSALFMFKRLVEANANKIVDIFERNDSLGRGMPYSIFGASDEHITNVSPNEIPEIVTPVEEWVKKASPALLKRFNIYPATINNYKVLPRLFFGSYLKDQFDLLLDKAQSGGTKTTIHLNAEVIDIIDLPELKEVSVITLDGVRHTFDTVIICTGHQWPVTHEGRIPGYLDSPYPPAKLGIDINYPVAIRGSSLTAIDAVRTLAHHNGKFVERDGILDYELKDGREGFKILMHSLNGLLPAMRFHLEDSHLQNQKELTPEMLQENKDTNEGFVSLDYIFEKSFKEPLKSADPDMYNDIRNFKLEEFVEKIMSLREKIDAFTLFKAEYAEAEKSIKRKESVHWKELLAILSFAMNYPAKHFSAEDMLRLQKVLKPLISIVIAFVPQSSAKELMALYDSGLLELVSVDSDSYVVPGEQSGAIIHYTDADNKNCSVSYQLFIDCIGQPQLTYNQFPFKSLVDNATVSPATLKFRSVTAGQSAMTKESNDIVKSDAGDYYLKVPGIAINDNFQVRDRYSAANPRIYVMAVPYIGGYNPDYSGLDFCEAASLKILNRILEIKQ